jgi:alpha-tubulin suppressor-like RCC1 family protein
MSITFWSALNKLKPQIVLNIKFFCIFSAGANEVLIVTKNDKVFAFGDNNSGCLGLGHNNTVKEPEIVNELCDQQIIDISFGSKHVLALTKSGKCFSWGHNFNGELGNGTQLNANKPKLITALIHENITQIMCGYNHSFVITKCGELYGFGYNYEGEIGCGYDKNQLTPIKINGFNNEKIVSIACGGYHSLVLTDMGSVYSCGFNSSGQLGIGNTAQQNRFQKIDLTQNEVIKSIACGTRHSLLLTTDGDIYAFGCNSFGQIGNGNTTDQLNPMRINGSRKFKEIISNFLTHISVAKADNNYCYVWGECENKLILTPKKTDIKSIHEIFAKYTKCKITPKAIHLY